MDDTDSSSDLSLPVHSVSALPSTAAACTKQTAAADATFDSFFSFRSSLWPLEGDRTAVEESSAEGEEVHGNADWEVCSAGCPRLPELL